jgi:hypothetical protein
MWIRSVKSRRWVNLDHLRFIEATDHGETHKIWAEYSNGQGREELIQGTVEDCETAMKAIHAMTDKNLDLADAVKRSRP